MKISFIRFGIRTLLMVTVCASSYAATADAALNKCAFDRNKLLAQDLDTFDLSQDGHHGLSAKQPGCDLAIADLIADYRSARPDAMKHANSYLLYWHEGQYRATAGQYQQTEKLFERSRLPVDFGGLMWNPYVDATVAFVRRDRPALQKARAALVALPPEVYKPAPEPIFLDIVDGLVSCFERTYAEAYQNCRVEKLAPGLVARSSAPVPFSSPIISATGSLPLKLGAYAQCDGHPRIEGKIDAGMVRIDLPARTNCTVQVGEWDWDAIPVPIFDAATAVPLPVLVYPRTVPEPALARELIEMGHQDQALRSDARRWKDADFAKRAQSDDSVRQQRLAKIIAAKGWPTISMVGWEAANAAWLVAQHSPQKSLKPWLSLMQQAAIKHEIRPSHLATTVDRVLVYDNKKQRYGTQSRDLNGANTPYPIADMAQLAQRRLSVGLPASNDGPTLSASP